MLPGGVCYGKQPCMHQRHDWMSYVHVTCNLHVSYWLHVCMLALLCASCRLHCKGGLAAFELQLACVHVTYTCVGVSQGEPSDMQQAHLHVSGLALANTDLDHAGVRHDNE